ncbi:MAG: sugar ABC transporter permease [Oscillospiraceae bacterium]|jgi:ABC-type sugar transport system permease subunit|nr:sugar ABC transporter permease [Oscillospiraceae bacterium]
MTTTVKMKRRGLTLVQRRSISGLMFISPFVIGFIIFYVFSIGMTVRFALSNSIDTETGFQFTGFAGLRYFNEAFSVHPSFRQILTQSLGNMIIDVPLILFFSLFMALMLNQKFKGRTVARAIFFLPVLLNSPSIATALSTAQGTIIGGNSPVSTVVMDAVGGSGGFNIDFYLGLLGDAIPQTILDYIAGAVSRISTIVTSSGVQIIIFLAALQSISPSLYEVAKIEGATPYETFWKVTFPMVSPLLVTNMVYTVVDSFITSQVLDLAYRTTFNDNNYSLGSVFSLVSMLSVCGILLIAGLWVSKRTFYQN